LGRVKEAVGTPPPTGRGERGVLNGPALGQCLDHRRKSRRLWRRAADIEDTRLVVIYVARDEGVPVVRAEEGPNGDGAEIDAAALQSVRDLPHFIEPAYLLVRCVIEMRLRDRDRPPIPPPHLVDQ